MSAISHELRVYDRDMGGELRVDPDKLQGAATAQVDIGASVNALGSGASMEAAGGGMSGLQTEEACQFAASILDSAAGVVHQELTTHAAKLASAADLYRKTDEQFGQRLRKFTP